MNDRLHFLGASRRRLSRFALAAGCALALGAVQAAPKPAAIDDVTGTKYKADADMAAVLQALAKLNGKPIETLDVPNARKQPTMADAVNAVLKAKGKDTEPTAVIPSVTSADRVITGGAKPMIARVYTPYGKGPFPVILYFHGGGWVLANKNVYDAGPRRLAKEAESVVVSVDYRLAPEAKFPAAWDDALAAYKWVLANAKGMNGKADKIGLAGESAGGNLAVATAVAARDAKLQMPLHILAVYPVAQTEDMNTPSYQDSANAKPLNKAMIGWFVQKVFAKPTDAADPRVNLVKANLSKLPTTTIVSAQIDPLRSDGDLLAAALKKAGVAVEQKTFTGVTHEFFGAGAVVKKAQEAVEYSGGRLLESFK